MYSQQYAENRRNIMPPSSSTFSSYLDTQTSHIQPTLIDKPTNILNLDKNNGRVNILQNQEDPTVLFRMQERIALKNKATEYREALNGTWEDNVLSRAFFSAKNIQILQNAIRAGVYEKSKNKYVVAPPNIDTLKIIMRSTYLTYAEHYPTKLREQIERLNSIVLDYAIPATYNEAVGYLRYIEDQSTLVVPLDLPLNHDRQYKQLELKPFF
jgi:hypothetical protein